jgi:hypothetical protein
MYDDAIARYTAGTMLPVSCIHVSAHVLGDIAFAAGKEIVDADEICAALQQSLAQVKAKKAAPPQQDALFELRATSPTRGATRRRQRLTS